MNGTGPHADASSVSMAPSTASTTATSSASNVSNASEHQQQQQQQHQQQSNHTPAAIPAAPSSSSPPVPTASAGGTPVVASSLAPPTRSRRPSADGLETSDSEPDDEEKAKYSRQNTLSRAGTLGGSGANGNGTGNGDAAATATRKLNRKEKRALKSKHRKINTKHPEFELTYDMMLGIRTVVGNNLGGAGSPAAAGLNGSTSDLATQKADGKRLSDAKKKAQEQTLKLAFPGQGSSRTPAHAMRDFKFKDYNADIFKKIRDIFKVEPTEYLLCVCGNFQYLEFISNSKSGQFFFYSHDRQYMIKTISGDECKFLRSILPSYLEHIQSNPHTLLTRFYGMHRVRPHKKKEVHFLIMKSVFSSGADGTSKFVHTVFDLKGSRQGRSATQKEKDSGAAVYKDNDFLDMGITIKLGPERAKQLNAQIASDCQWLSSLNIMDYSLLLGIHYKDRMGDIYGPQDASLTNINLNGTAPAAQRNGSILANGKLSPTHQNNVLPASATVAASSNPATTSSQPKPQQHPPVTVNDVRIEGLAVTGANGTLDDYELIRASSPDKLSLPPMMHLTQAQIDGTDDGGIYTQLHPPRAQREDSHLEPHSPGSGQEPANNGGSPSGGSLNAQKPKAKPKVDVHSPTPRSLTLTLPTPSPVTISTIPAVSSSQSSAAAANHVPTTAGQVVSPASGGGRLISPVESDEEDTVQFHYASGTPPIDTTTTYSLSPRSGGGGGGGQKFMTTGSGLQAFSPNASQAQTPHPHNDFSAGGPFTSRAWNIGRAGRSQSALTIVSSPNRMDGSLHHLDAATALSKKEAKEMAAAAKLDAIAKQTAYGLPKKYNKVSRPGDIAFPFEFDQSDGTMTSMNIAAAGMSPVHMHFPSATPIGDRSSLSPPHNPTKSGRNTAQGTPIMKALVLNPERGQSNAHGTQEFDLAPPDDHQPLQPGQRHSMPSGLLHNRALSVITPGRAASGNSSAEHSPNHVRRNSASIPGSQRSILQSPTTNPLPTPNVIEINNKLHALTLPAPNANPSAVAATHVPSSPRLSPAVAAVAVATNGVVAPIAVHSVSPEEHKSSASSSAAQAQTQAQADLQLSDPFGTDGGCPGQNPDGTYNNEIYFMGIIDILQQWNTSKKAEHFAKVFFLRNEGNEISAVKPSKYADRFKQFISARLK